MSAVTTITFLDHFNKETDRYEEVQLPAKYVVCPDCKGRGSSSAYLGAYTRDELDELGEEFLEDYRAGNFDRPCDRCKGQRVIAVVDEELCDTELLKEYKEVMAVQAEANMAAAAESRYFAMASGDWR